MLWYNDKRTRTYKWEQNPLPSLEKNTDALIKNLRLTTFFQKLQPISNKCTIARAYGLVKIHKTNFPVRPIISAINTPTYYLSKMLAKFLFNNLKRPSSHVNNSLDLKQKIENVCAPMGYTIISLDVISLFTNVADYLIFDSLEKRWNQLYNFCELNCSEFINVISFILHNNYFVFNDTYYKQIFDAAVGNPLSPILADIVMEDLENRALSKICFPVPFYYRYVDNIIICVPERMINYTVNLFNSFDNNLQFTVETSTNNKISFLDILIIQNKQKIFMDWYRKPTFSGRFLNFKSHH